MVVRGSNCSSGGSNTKARGKIRIYFSFRRRKVCVGFPFPDVLRALAYSKLTFRMNAIETNLSSSQKPRNICLDEDQFPMRN